MYSFFAGGGGGPCLENPSSDPPGITIAGATELATRFEICLHAFNHQELSTVMITRPDGTIISRSDHFGITYPSAPSDLVGTYEIHATQGSLVASTSIVMQLPTVKRMLRLGPLYGTAGSRFDFWLAGFQPNATVFLDLCERRGQAELCDYRTSLSVVMDDTGQAIFELQTQSDDPSGSYCVVPRGVQGTSAWRHAGDASADCDGRNEFIVT